MKGKFSLSVMPSKSQTAQKHGYSAMPSGCSVWICRFLFLLLYFFILLLSPSLTMFHYFFYYFLFLFFE